MFGSPLASAAAAANLTVHIGCVECANSDLYVLLRKKVSDENDKSICLQHYMDGLLNGPEAQGVGVLTHKVLLK